MVRYIYNMPHFFYRYSNKESPPFALGTPHINCGSVEKPCGLSGIIRQYLTSHFGLIFFMMSSFLKEITPNQHI